MSEYPEGCGILFGASGGLGSSTALRMAEMGADLVLTYRGREAPLLELKSQIEALGRKAVVTQCDTTKLESVQAAVALAEQTFGRVHSAVNATGLAYQYRTVVKLEEQQLRDVLDTDVMGLHNIARAVVPAMRKGSGGSIVTVGTASIDRTSHGNSLSAVPKAAAAMLVRILALEEGRHGIRVNMVGAGAYAAGMALVMAEMGNVGSLTMDDFTRDATALRRTGQAEEFGGLTAFLTTNRASYVTGQIVHVDGGLSV